MANNNKSNDGFVFIETGGQDRFNLAQLDKIRCPDCGKDNLVKASEKDVYICRSCGLALPESQLGEAVTVIPDSAQGVSTSNKPYFQQIQQNKKSRASDYVNPIIGLQEDDNAKILRPYSLIGLAETERERLGGVTVTQQGQRIKKPNEQVIKGIRKLFPSYVSDIKIDLY